MIRNVTGEGKDKVLKMERGPVLRSQVKTREYQKLGPRTRLNRALLLRFCLAGEIEDFKDGRRKLHLLNIIPHNDGLDGPW